MDSLSADITTSPSPRRRPVCNFSCGILIQRLTTSLLSANARLDLDLSHCTELHTAYIALWLDCTITLLNQQRSEALWGLHIGALSRVPPGALREVDFRIHIVPNSNLRAHGSCIASQSITAIRDVKWSLLDTVLDKHPLLRTIQVHFVYDGPRLTPMQMFLIQSRLSPRLKSSIRFSSAYPEQLPYSWKTCFP